MRPGKKLTIVVIGDLMLDEYIVGPHKRPSPESRVDVLQNDQSFSRPGGAANVVMNVHTMGAYPIPLGVIGNDREGVHIKKYFRERNLPVDGIFIDHSRPTTLKTRIYHGQNQLLRIDREQTDIIGDHLQLGLLNQLQSILQKNKVDGLLIQDYDKGVLSVEFINEVRSISGKFGIPLLVDPKFKHFREYKNVVLLKPNLRECEKFFGNPLSITPDNLRHTGKTLIQKMGMKNLVITLSENGIFGMDQNSKYVLLPALPIRGADVCGAGDAVITSLTLSLLHGKSLPESCRIANVAGHIACRSLGAAPVIQGDIDKILASLKSDIRGAC